MRAPAATPKSCGGSAGRGRSVSDAEGLFAAVEDQWNYEVLLVAEVAIEPAQELVAVLRVGLAGAADAVTVGRLGAEERARRFDHRDDGLVDLLVIALEHLEAADE